MREYRLALEAGHARFGARGGRTLPEVQATRRHGGQYTIGLNRPGNE